MISKIVRQKINNKNFQHIIKNICWLLAQSGLIMFLRLFVGVLIARYLKPQQFGVLSYALALTAIFQPLSSLGINSILTREFVSRKKNLGEILGTGFTLRLCGGLLSFILIFSFVILFPLEDSRLKFGILILSSVNLFQPLEVVDFWFRSQVLSKYIVISRCTVSIVGAGCKLFLLYIQAPLSAFIIVFGLEQIFSHISLIVPYYIKQQSFSSWKFDFSYGKKLIFQSWPLILSGFGAIIYLKIDQIMLGSMTTKNILGNYAVASKLSETWYFIPTAIASSVFPSLLESKQIGIKAYHQKLQKLYDNLALLAMMIAVPTTFLSTHIVIMIYGTSYRSAGLILSIHIWAGVFIFMRAVFSKWLIAENLLIFSIVTQCLGAIINVLLNLFLIPTWGGVGAAVATIISYATSSYISLFIFSPTIPTGKMMTLALFAPIRFLLKISKTA